MGKPSSSKRRNKADSKKEYGGGGGGESTDQKAGDTIKERRSKKDHRNGQDASSSSVSSSDESVWKVVLKHPTFWAVILLAIPFGLPFVVRRMTIRAVLQYPHLLNRGLDFLDDRFGYAVYKDGYRFRSALNMTEPRQVLILGSISSGSSQTAHDFQDMLGLEVGHEDTDTTQYFVRDGTVSWYHGIRYLDRSPKEQAQTIVDLCAVNWRIYSSDKMNFNNAWSNYGTELILFGPTKFDLPHWHPSFRKSFLQTCHRTLLFEVGCGLEDHPDGGDDKCPTPFQRTLIQTRQPWRIVTSMVTKYCSSLGGSKDQLSYRSAPTSLLKLLQALYPNHKDVWFPPTDDDGDTEETKSTNDEKENENDKSIAPDDDKLKICSNQMATYVTLWYNDLLDSFDKVRKDAEGWGRTKRHKNSYGVYPVETTPICEVAEMAGFDYKNKNDNGDLVIYPPNLPKVTEFCQQNPEALFGNTENQFNTKSINNANDAANSKDTKKQETHESFEDPSKDSLLKQLLNVSTVRGVVEGALGKQMDALHLRMGYKKSDLQI